MNIMKIIQEEINSHLFQDNGTRYLRMDYEEILFPYFFTGKKKYYGISCIKTPNFHPKKLFVRGIDTVKIGQSKLFRDVGSKIMWKTMDLENNNNAKQIVEDIIFEV